MISKLTIAPAAELVAKACKPYPNDNAENRQACTALIAEIEPHRHIERVAAQRRDLPLGGRAPQ